MKKNTANKLVNTFVFKDLTTSLVEDSGYSWTIEPEDSWKRLARCKRYRLSISDGIMEAKTMYYAGYLSAPTAEEALYCICTDLEFGTTAEAVARQYSERVGEECPNPKEVARQNALFYPLLAPHVEALELHFQDY